MLTQLSITNFGLIDHIVVEFDAHLNILTGETGAGKSILIDALRCALGTRLSGSFVREADKSCELEVVFDLFSSELRELDIFQEYLEEDDAQLIIHRTLTAQGRHKINLNGRSITLGQLKTLGNYLIDFHGPHDHQLLLSSDSHLGMLDRLVAFGDLIQEYHEAFRQYHHLKVKLDELTQLAQSRNRELDLLQYQVKELEQISLDENYYEELLQDRAKIDNAQRLQECVQDILTRLDGDGSGAGEAISQSFTSMRILNQTDDRTTEYLILLDQLQDTHSQLVTELNTYADSLSVNDSEAQAIHEECDLIYDIKKKYGPSLAQAKTFYEEARAKLDLLANIEENDLKLRKELAQYEDKARVLAKKITAKRMKAAKALKTTIEAELTELGIKHVRFEVQIETDALNAQGQDSVVFYISPNLGEDLKPLAEIVSSGEAARVMLALKKALIQVDPVPVLIFDEIDAQIGGRLGTITGRKLSEIARHRQVILITHLPQIAAFADTHLHVSKAAQDGRAMTALHALDANSKVREIAKMMSGDDESAISIQHAKELIKAAI